MEGLHKKLKGIRNNFPLLTPAPDMIVLAELGLQNCTLYRQDRPQTEQVTRGRGVSISIEDKLNSSVSSFPSPPEVTCVDQPAVTVHVGNVKILIKTV